jgi:N-acetyl-anhydromuramyl-L-alanine amidase AmpD
MATYNARDFKKALKKAGVNAVYYEGWDSSEIDPFGMSPSKGIILHHTANGGAKGNNPSVAWQVKNEYFPVRAAHVNVGRNGLVTVLAARGAYHAGAGGGVVIGSGTVPVNQGNENLFGIEIESKGTDPRTDAKVTDVDGITPQQVESVTKLCVALCGLMKIDEKSVIRHRDWTDGGFGKNPWLPTRGRKNDVLQPLEWWRKKIKRALLASKIKGLFGR